MAPLVCLKGPLLGPKGPQKSFAASAKTKRGGGAKKKAISPFVKASGKKISVLLSALVERFSVSRMRDLKKKLHLI